MPKKEETITDELANLPNDGDPAFGEEKKTPASPAKNKEEKDADTPDAAKKDQEEENVPFHQHPRWKQREKDWEERVNSVESTYSEKIKNLEEKIKSYEPSKTTTIPTWFSKLYGENAEAYAAYAENDKARRAEIKAEVLQEVAAVENKKTEETKRWENWVSTNIKEMRDDGLEFDDNELMAVCVKFKPVDEKGNYSLRAAYEIMQLQKDRGDKGVAAKKEVAAATTNRSGEGTKKDYLTPTDLRGRDWRQLIK